ncbi:MAG: pilus assembly protein TadG-related protein [Verrucomicrobiia bacterium]
MKKTHNGRQREDVREHGQVLVMFVCFLVVLLLFVGMGIDLGFAYITQARLSKALDAAALAGMNNYYQGTNQALAIAQATFAANFSPNTNDAAPGYVTGTPTPSLVFSNSGPNVYLNASAYATNRTFFLGMLQYNTLAASDSAQATRLPLIMTLVLDHSYSMCPPSHCSGSEFTGGGEYLPGAVNSFIQDFVPGVDQAAVISFGSTWTNDVPMTSEFVTPIASDMNYAQNNPGIYWGGGTCSICGLTNALITENSIGSTGTAVKAVVFFTDGLANMIEQSISCPTPGPGPYNFGGFLPGSSSAAFYSTNLPADYCDQEYGDVCATTGSYGGDGACPNSSSPNTCCNGTQTYISFDGTPRQFNMGNIIYDATNQCILVARQMQQAGMYVFCIGLSAAGNGDVPDPDFLQTVANDPSNPNQANYDPALPSGVALVAGDGSDLPQLFQLIAAQIQLRLTR